MEADTIGYMPERFITGYFELTRLGLKIDPGAQQFDNESGNVKKKFHQHPGGLKDEAALRFKAWVDRQLRAIGRDMQAYLNARDSTGPSPVGLSSRERHRVAREMERQSELRCKSSTCDRYVSWQWFFCAWCGQRLREGVIDEQVLSQRQSNGRYVKQGGVTSQSEASAGGLEHVPGRARYDTDGADGSEAGRDLPGEGADCAVLGCRQGSDCLGLRARCALGLDA